METNIHFWSYLAQLFLEWEMFQTNIIENIKTHILCAITFLKKKIVTLRDNVKKHCRAMFLNLRETAARQILFS